MRRGRGARVHAAIRTLSAALREVVRGGGAARRDRPARRLGPTCDRTCPSPASGGASPRREGATNGSEPWIGVLPSRLGRGGPGAAARALPALLLAALLAGPALAVEPDEVLDDPALEARARDISTQVRCVVCASEPIDTSQAAIARDLRILIRERLVAGDSDAEVYRFLTDRYGDYVLFRPPFKASTWALWLAPAALLGAGAVGVGVAFRRRPAASPEPLTAEEAEELERLTREIQ